MVSAEQDAWPEVTLERVLDDLGSTFLRAVTPVPDPDRRVGGVTIHDPLDEQAVPEGAIVLGVAVIDPGQVRSLLPELGERRVAALVLREPVTLAAATLAAAQEHRVAVLALTRGASWTQLAGLLRSIVHEGPPVAAADDDTLQRLPSGDLFSLANAIAALLDAPVTIEDRSSRVLAFSGRQDEADPSRIETILERQVPQRYAQRLTDAGFFKEMFSSTGPVHIDLTREDGEQFLTRAAIAVRAGDEVLGSIWAAVHEPLGPERAAALTDAAKVVALHLLRIRAGSDAERRLRADLLGSALEGGDRAAGALDRLGLGDSDVVVLAVGTAPDPEDDLDGVSQREVSRQRVSDAVAMHLAAVHPRSCCALLGGTTYGLLPVAEAATGIATARRLATDFLTRLGDRTPVHIGISAVATGSRELPPARRGADRALRVLQEQASPRSRVAALEDVHVEALLLELRDAVTARGEGASGPLARLVAHDRVHGADLLRTLRVWLDTMGDVSAAAQTLHIHPNTFRYRLRRLAEIAEMDLEDPDVRFAAMLQLRVIPELVNAQP